MKKYPKYKDSEVEWLGEMPDGWQAMKLKFFAKICNGQDQKEVIDENGKYPIFGSGGVFGKANTFLYNKPSVLLGRKGTIDKPLYVTEPFWSVDTVYYTKINDNVSSKFFYYLCTTINFNYYKYGSAIPSMTQSDLNEIFFCCPPYQEQTQIVNYLNQKTSQIESLISKKEKLIELLKEERTAIINQAVTKGINPKVKLKDSGVEWLGEIPEHWEAWKLSHAFNKIGSGTTPESGNLNYYENGTINWLNTGDLNDGYLESCQKKITEAALTAYSALKVFPANSVVIAMYGATIGKVSIVTFETALNQACCLFFGSEIIKTEFLFYWFRTQKENIIKLAKGGGQPNISQDILKSLKIPCPPTKEQNEITEFIKSENDRVESIIVKTEQEIELLREYKTALISEVVTGKVDVRGELTKNKHDKLELHN